MRYGWIATFPLVHKCVIDTRRMRCGLFSTNYRGRFLPPPSFTPEPGSNRSPAGHHELHGGRERSPELPQLPSVLQWVVFRTFKCQICVCFRLLFSKTLLQPHRPTGSSHVSYSFYSFIVTIYFSNFAAARIFVLISF